jgi:AsmA protein
VTRPAKIIFGLLAAVVIAAVAAAVAVPFLVDADTLRTRAEAELTKALGRHVKLGRPSVSLWTGLRLDAAGVRIGEPLTGPSASVPILEAGRTSVRLAILPLLRRQVVARSLALDGASILQDGKPLLSELSLRSSLRIESDGAIEAAGRVHARIDLLATRPPFAARFATRYATGRLDVLRLDADVGPVRCTASGRVDGVSSKAPEAHLDLGLALARSNLSGPLTLVLGAGAPTARFNLTAPRLDLGELAALPSAFAGTTAPAVPQGIQLTGVTAELTMVRGEVRLDGAKYSGFGGAGQGTVTAHPFQRERAFNVDQSVAGVSIGALIAAFAPAQKGALDGKASLVVGLTGRAGEVALLPTLSGSGSLAIRDGAIKTVGVIQQVMRLLESAGAKGIAKNETPFDRLTADFAVTEGVAATQNLEFRSADLDFDGRGTVGLGGALKLDVLASFSKTVTSQLVAKTPALSIRVASDGRLTVPLQIRGTVQEPRVQLDLDKVIKEGVVKELKKEGTKSLLKKLFGR